MTEPTVIRKAIKGLFHSSIHLAPRSQNPYASHLPVLCALSAVIEPARIVEFGSGLISTSGFQNRAAFPKLVSLLSFENDPEWYRQVAQKVGDDRRVVLRLTDGPIKDVVQRLDFSSIDLIFVDDSRSHEERANTIAQLAERGLPGVPVVIHDLDLWKIRRSAQRFQHVFCMDALNPQTGVAWNGKWLGERALQLINRLIQDNSESLPTTDATQWADLFRCKQLLP